MAENLKTLVSNLSKRGPHRVLVGDLSYVGLPGVVYTPAKGKGVPGIAFGHDWRAPVEDYHATLRHLASWGIAVAAPNTETGFVPDHRGLANDLESALQILGGVRLGEGEVTVSPAKLGLAGHGMGAGAAVLAATSSPSPAFTPPIPHRRRRPPPRTSIARAWCSAPARTSGSIAATRSAWPSTGRAT